MSPELIKYLSSESFGLVFSGICTLVASVLLAWLGPRFFAQRISSVTEAVGEVKRLVSDMHKTVDPLRQSLGTVGTQVEVLGAQVQSVNVTVSALQGSLGKLQGSSEETERETEEIVHNGAKILSLWYEIRDRIEQIAANPNIDAERRAEFSQIPRRSYLGLIDELDRNGLLGDDAHKWREAWRLRNIARRQRDASLPDEFEAMSKLSKVLLSADMVPVNSATPSSLVRPNGRAPAHRSSTLNLPRFL